jgi:hypothetical protein
MSTLLIRTASEPFCWIQSYVGTASGTVPVGEAFGVAKGKHVCLTTGGGTVSHLDGTTGNVTVTLEERPTRCRIRRSTMQGKHTHLISFRISGYRSHKTAHLPWARTTICASRVPGLLTFIFAAVGGWTITLLGLLRVAQRLAHGLPGRRSAKCPGRHGRTVEAFRRVRMAGRIGRMRTRVLHC